MFRVRAESNTQRIHQENKASTQTEIGRKSMFRNRPSAIYSKILTLIKQQLFTSTTLILEYMAGGSASASI